MYDGKVPGLDDLEWVKSGDWVILTQIDEEDEVPESILLYKHEIPAVIDYLQGVLDE